MFVMIEADVLRGTHDHDGDATGGTGHAVLA